MRTTIALRTLALGALVLGACGDDKQPAMTGQTATKTSADDDSDSNSDTGSLTEPPVTTSGGSNTDTGIVDPPETSSTGGAETGPDPDTGTPVDTESTGCQFICDPTETGPGPTNECDIWAEDCPEGQKCMPWAADGGTSWNATKCSPVQNDPGQVGDVCTVEGSGVSGIDSCDKHLLCWYTDEMNVGTCINMCEGSEDSFSCPDMKQKCDISNDGVLILCLETCDPLVQSCPEGQICFFDGLQDFICDFDASGEEGQFGDECAFINVCDYGLFCAAPETVPGCEAEGCCSNYCDLSEPNNTCIGEGQECVPWYAEGEAPDGQQDIGACSLPI